MPDDAPWAEPVVVPDDLRSLQADVEAYHRERRLAQRRRRVERITHSKAWRRLGVPIAVLFGALALGGTIFAALLLGHPSAQPVPVAAPLATDAAATGTLGGLIPDVSVATDQGNVSMHAPSMRPAVVALVPVGCSCTDLLAGVAAQADELGLPLVAVAPQSEDAEVDALAGQLHRGRVLPVFDSGGELAATYGGDALTVLGLAVDGTVGFVLDGSSAELDRLELRLHSLLSSAPARTD